MSKTAAFPKILHVGDKQISDLFETEVEITEKLDGSQFGFGRVDGELTIRSKGREIDLEAFDKMFGEGVAYVKSIQDRIPDGMFFYGEYLQKPRHSTLAYDRIPKNHIALFGVYNLSTREYFDYDTIQEWADKLDVDAVPIIARGISSPEAVLAMVNERQSYLGGQKIEGVVVKAYKPWLFLGQIPLNVMAGKYVTEAFKEVHGGTWTKLNTAGGKLGVLKANYRSEARWNKAVQHIKEAGELQGSPKDIGAIIKEIHKDIIEEEQANIKEQLWNVFGKDILSEATNGVPQWYKEKILLGGVNDELDTTQPTETLEQALREGNPTFDNPGPRGHEKPFTKENSTEGNE